MKNTNQSNTTRPTSKAVQTAMDLLVSISQVRNLLWYVLLLVTFFLPRSHAMFIINPMYFPPIITNPGLHSLMYPETYNISKNYFQTTDGSFPNQTPENIMTTPTPEPHPGPNTEAPTYLPYLLLVGALLATITGVTTALCLRTKRRPSAPPAYEAMGKTQNPVELTDILAMSDWIAPYNLAAIGEVSREEMQQILSKEAHLRTPWEKLAADKWMELYDSN